MPQNRQEMIVIQAVETELELTLEEFCLVCEVEREFIKKLIQHGTIEINGPSVEHARFNAEHLRRVQAALRLHHDLGINHAGIALTLDLLDEIGELRQQLDVLERYFSALR